MTEGKEKKVEQPPVEPPPEETPPPEVQPTTYTQEQLDAFVAEAEKQGYKKSQRVISEREKELKALREQAPSFGQFSPTVAEGLLGVLEAQQVELGERNPNIAKLKAQITVERQKEVQQQQWAQWQKVVTQQKEKLDKAVEALKLNPDDEALGEVYEAFEDAAEFTGRFERAHKKLDKIAKKIEPKEPKGTKGKAELTDEEKEEIARSYLEKEGRLTSETGGPSAGSPSKADARAKFARGEITEEEAKKAGVEFV